MNASFGLDIVNTTLRMAMFCQSANLLFVRDPSGVGVAWHGYTAWDFADLQHSIGFQYKIVTELPNPEENLHPPMLSLMRDEADISIDYWGVNYMRSTLIDFSYPRLYTGDYIISGIPKQYIHADLIMGVFDNISFLCLTLALISMIIVSWLTLFMDNQEQPLVKSIFNIFGNAFKQPLTTMPSSVLGQAIFNLLFSLYNFLICLMYGCIIMSLLIGGSPPPTIDSLEDLNKTENMNVRIILHKNGYTYKFLQSANMLDGFEHRIDHWDISDWYKPYMLENILRGSHVAIFSLGNFDHHLCQTKGNDGLLIANMNDFRHSR